jgi:23S rRNA pseudouridine1911/1915/1917 synthase
MIEFCLLYSIESVEFFLIEYFHVSRNTVKFYFDKKFLKRPFDAHSILQLPLDFVNDLEIFPKYEGPAVDVVFENELFLVINKPANIFSHPLTYTEKNNCLSYLRENRPEVLRVNERQYDRGLLYRLDFETSGVLVYVKEEGAYLELRKNFNSFAKEKKYLCWVEGECRLSGNFKHYFKATEEKGKKIRVSDENIKGDYQEAEFVLAPKKYNVEANATLMEVLLGRGLRHQIRSQLAYLGFPLRGDLLYGGKPAERLYLHAEIYKINFREKEYKFEVAAIDFLGL